MGIRVRQAFIGVGANLGDRWAAIQRALAALARTSGILAVESSGVYETIPVGVSDQPKFLNLIAGIETTLAPEQLLMVLHALEDAAGRKRACEIRWGPRVLDLDLLLYEGEERAGPELVLPHPRMWERAFVLVPLRELLSRSMRFRRPAWADLRARLATVNVPVAGVQRWGA
jgi:2-amino-4-hydroxy-6-hydroxymethyldihydropteridine diphosphokinase